MGSIPTINRKLNLQTHTSIHSRTYACMYACMHVCIHDVGKLLMNQQRTCCLIDKWAQERKRAAQSEREERDQTKLIEINSRRTSVCMYMRVSLCVCVCVCMAARGMCEKTRPMTATAIKQRLPCLPAVVYTMWNSGMSKYLLVAWRLLRCCRVVVIAFAPDTRRLRRHTLHLNTLT